MWRDRGWGVTAAWFGTVVIAGALLDGFVIEPHRLVIKRISLPCEGLSRGPVRALLFADVDFLSPGRREETIRREAAAFAPDLVFVAGDFLDRPRSTRDRSVLEGADEFFRSLGAPVGRFLAPGEKEAEVYERLREAFSDGAIEVLSNEARRLEVRGETLDLFVANPPGESAPWGIATEGGRWFVHSRGRFRHQYLIYGGDGAADWGDAEYTFAFMALDRTSFLEFRFAWHEEPGVVGGRGFRIVRNEYRPDFRLDARSDHSHALDGRWQSGFVPPVGVWCRARVRMADEGGRTRVRARFWLESETEPATWSIDAVDRGNDRPRRGTVGFAGRSGSRRYADLRVVGPDGQVILDEPFRDPARLRGAWHYRSALADWALGPGLSKGSSAVGAPPQSGHASSAARILLTHDPDIVLDLVDLGAPPPSIVLAGHTHGGQVRLPWIGALYTSTHIGRHYDKGFFEYSGIPLFITSGVGTSTVPIRFFDPPEIVLLTLTPPAGAR